MSESCFQLKGSVVTVVVLELHHYSPEVFVEQLRAKIAQAPQLLGNSPVVFSLERFADQQLELDFASLVAACRELGVQPLGIRSCAPFNAAAQATGLAVLPVGSAREAGPAREPARRPMPQQQPVESRPATKLITTPVRSGQQVYARNADLIVMSQVSEGAEVLADGNIHIYGGLRGRALAGVGGDESARIFCHRLDAELLAVAGNFLLSEDVPKEHWKKSVQVFLQDDRLNILPL